MTPRHASPAGYNGLASFMVLIAMSTSACASTPADGGVQHETAPKTCAGDQDCTASGSAQVNCVESFCKAGVCSERPMANGAVCAAASCDHGQPPAWSPARTCLDQVCLKTQAIPCQDDSVCSLDLCDDTKGCLHPPANGPCDDGSVCSQDDKCVDGVCKGGTKVCECAQDSDCADLDDDNACNGRYICNEIDNKCLVDPASIVACSNHKDTACLANQCDPKIGACDMKSLKDGTSCDDGRACTQSDVCIDGYCIGKGDCGG